MINKIGLILGVIGLILSIVYGTLYYNNLRKVKEVMSKAEQDIATIEGTSKLRQDSALLEIRKRDSTITSLQVAQKEAAAVLNESVKTSERLAVDLMRAKAKKDTVDYYAKCDSLADQVVLLEEKNEFFQDKVTLLNLNYQKQLADKDTLLKVKDELYSKLREAFNGSKLKINELTAEKEGLEMKLQRSRRTSRLVTLLGVAAAGGIYLSIR